MESGRDLNCKFQEKKREIPLEVLILPDDYFFSVFPTFWKSRFGIIKPILQFELRKQKINITFEKTINYAKRQAGSILKFLVDMGFSDDAIVQMLISSKPIYPKGLQPLDFDCGWQDLDSNKKIMPTETEIYLSPLLDGEIEILTICNKIKKLRDINSKPDRGTIMTLNKFYKAYNQWRLVKKQLLNLPTAIDAQEQIISDEKRLRNLLLTFETKL